MTNKKRYQTKDFYLSAYLLSTGFPLIAAVKTAGLTLFEFNESNKLNIAVTDFYAFKSTVEPITFGNSIRTLKTIIHSNTNGTEQYHSQPTERN